MMTKKSDEGFSSVPSNCTLVCDVVGHFWKEFLVEVNEVVKRSFTDIKGTECWKEVVSYEEAKEDEVVDDPLQIKLDLHFGGEGLVFEKEVFSQN